MINAIGRAAAAGLFAAFAGAVWLASIYGWSPGLQLDFYISAPRTLVSGVYPAERDAASGRTFAWTAETLTINLPDLDRHVEWTLDLRVRAARPAGLPHPTLSFFVDGVLVSSRPAPGEFENLQIPIAARPAKRGLTIALQASPTFIPGPDDPRHLGVMLDSLTVTPDGIVLPPRPAIAGVVAGSALIGVAIALLGVTAGTAVGAAALLAAALAALVARGFGPYTDYGSVVARTTMWVAGATIALTAATRAWRREPFRNTAKFAVGFTCAALLLELLVLLHPNMPIGDALFHAHRFQDVLAGHLYFTSIAPGNYHFPYAPGLYVLAKPFAGLVRRGDSDMTLLRSIVCAADALAGLLLYPLTLRIRGDRLAAALTVALYHLIPLGFNVVAVGNLTNAFAQSLSVAALAVIAWPGVRLEHRGAVALLSISLAAAFLSHTSAFAIGSVAACLIVALYWWYGGPALKSPAYAVLAATILAVAIAVLIYYAHFIDTYRQELARIGNETATAAPDAGGRGIMGRLLAVPRYLHLYYRVPILALACWGAVALWQRSSRDRGTLAATGWAAGCGLFLILGILTPVDMRHYLAAIPAVAIAAATAGGLAWTSGGTSRLMAAGLLGWTVLAAVGAWWKSLG